MNKEIKYRKLNKENYNDFNEEIDYLESNLKLLINSATPFARLKIANPVIEIFSRSLDDTINFLLYFADVDNPESKNFNHEYQQTQKRRLYILKEFLALNKVNLKKIRSYTGRDLYMAAAIYSSLYPLDINIKSKAFFNQFKSNAKSVFKVLSDLDCKPRVVTDKDGDTILRFFSEYSTQNLSNAITYFDSLVDDKFWKDSYYLEYKTHDIERISGANSINTETLNNLFLKLKIDNNLKEVLSKKENQNNKIKI